MSNRYTRAVINAPLDNIEEEILVLLAEGRSYEQAAYIMGYSRHTIKDCMGAVRIKLNAYNVPHAVAIALRKGVIK